MLFRILFVATSLVLASGCATVTRGTTESFVVESDPAGATVTSSTGWTCTTPCSVKVKRRSDFTLNIEKDGYRPVTATVTSSVDGAGAAGMAGNVILGGLIGAGIDAGTGAMHSHKPNPLQISMEPHVEAIAEESTRDGGPETATATDSAGLEPPASDSGNEADRPPEVAETEEDDPGQPQTIPTAED